MYLLHVLYRPMTLLAGDAGKYMLAVIEIHEIWKIMYLDPRDGAVLLHGFFEFFNLDSLFFEQAMTVHADARRRDPSVSARSRGKVAIHAGNLIVTSVDSVGKGNRLIRSVALMDADTAAQRVIKDLKKRKKLCYFPLRMRFLMWLSYWAADWMIDRGMRRYEENPPKPREELTPNQK